MANTTETTKSTTRGRKPKAETTTAKTNSATTDSAVAELQAENAKMREQMEQLMKMIEQNNSTQSTVSEVVTDDDTVTVISLVPHKLNLCTEWGGGVVYTFNQMYEAQEIDFGDLKAIVRTNKDMVQNGRFYIADEKAVSKLRLKTYYNRILTPENLQKLLTLQPEKAVEMYSLAPQGQQGTVIEMIEAKLEKGETVDANILQQLGKLSGKELLKSQ